MVSVGERTGQLGQLLAASANRMEEDVDARLKALVSILEPLMIVVMGLIVGVITVSIIMPISPWFKTLSNSPSLPITD